jgi:hypothetical protein
MQRAPARTFQDLIVWRKGQEFALGMYQLTAGAFHSDT